MPLKFSLSCEPLAHTETSGAPHDTQPVFSTGTSLLHEEAFVWNGTQWLVQELQLNLEVSSLSTYREVSVD